MKIALAQISPEPNNFNHNLDAHCRFILDAAAQGAEMIVFGELSLTGYEPELANEIAIASTDMRLSVLQELSDEYNIIIGVGAPVRRNDGVTIATLFYQPHRPMLCYAKQILSPPEEALFITGNEDLILTEADKHIAVAICFESMQIEFTDRMLSTPKDLYLTIVAKTEAGMPAATSYYAEAAQRYQTPVAMVNLVGDYGGTFRAGQTAYWDRTGHLVDQLPQDEEGMLWVDI